MLSGAEFDHLSPHQRAILASESPPPAAYRFGFDLPAGPQFTDAEKEAQRVRGREVMPMVMKAFESGAAEVRLPGDYRFGQERYEGAKVIYPLGFEKMRRDAAHPFVIHRTGLGDSRVLSAIAAVVANHSPHAKWKVLVTNTESGQPLTPLFLSLEKNDTAWGQPELLFAARGLHRGRLELRHLSLPPDPRLAANFWLKLRSLFGTSSRAEIMLQLLVSGPATATEIARASGFTTRSILVPLREMALSGHLYEPPRPARTRPLRGQPAVARTRGPSQDYALRQAEWEFLRTWEEPSGFPRLESPLPLLRLCRVAIDLDVSASGDSAMLQGLRLREAAAGPLAEIHRLGLSGSYGLPTDLSGDRLAATLSESLPALITDL